MITVTVKEFVEMAIALEVGASIRFQHNDEDANIMEYIIAPVKLGDSDCLLANCVGGGRPLVIDVSTYDSGLKTICEELDQYINYATGKYGYVTVLKQSDAAAVREVHVLVRYPETDMEPSFIAFTLNDVTTKESLISSIHAAAAVICGKEYEDSDRLTRFDALSDWVAEKTGCAAHTVRVDCELDIW